MTGTDEIISEQAFERAGVPAFLVAMLVTILVVWLAWGIALWLLTVVGALVFGFSFGLALWVIADPVGFLKALMHGLH
ncbi:MAG: hypothetical protein VX501_04680 [Pseudomonadota bacterium]|nr:hypothetical protein [Pseudomonadota bacterium]